MALKYSSIKVANAFLKKVDYTFYYCNSMAVAREELSSSSPVTSSYKNGGEAYSTHHLLAVSTGTPTYSPFSLVAPSLPPALEGSSPLPMCRQEVLVALERQNRNRQCHRRVAHCMLYVLHISQGLDLDPHPSNPSA